MAITIDGLQLEITENSEKAVEGLNALTQSLERLKNVTSGLEKSLSGISFDKVGQQIKQLSLALQPLQGFKSQAGSVISSLRRFRQTAQDFNQFTEFDKFSSQIKLLAESLQPLANFSTKIGATLNALAQVPAISDQLESVDFESFGQKITDLTQSLSPLGTIQSKLGATLNQLTRFGQVTQQLDVTLKESNVANNISTLVESLRPLTTLGKPQLGSFLNQLKKLPEVMTQLASVDINALSEKLNRLATAIRPLADEMNKVAAGFSAFPARIQKLITQSERLTSSNKKLSESYNILGISFKPIYAKLGVMYLGVKRLANMMSDWVLKSNEYVENLNLFTVAMGKYAGEALEYAQQVQESMGIDMSEWIRNQGIFMQIATGFGVAQDKAYQMSKALTQVSYDISSFFNIPIEEALRKVQAGISGELEPLRRLGYALDAATLQQIAYAHGIELSINRMTQAQKSQLRFIAIMEQSKNVIGDMARTLVTPANALRILNQQLLQLRRALGDMIIPLLIKIIPYVQAFVKVLTNAIRRVASFLGFELPEIDYSGLEGLASGANEVSEGLGNATKNAKKLKNALAPFDELNVLDFAEATGSSGVSGGVGGFDLGLDLSQYDYDFLGKVKSQVDEIAERLQKAFERILDLAIWIGAVIAGWKISNALYSLFTGQGTNAFFQGINKLFKAFVHPSGKTVKLSSLFGNATAYVETAAVLAGIAATIAIIIARFVDLIRHNERFRDGLKVIWDGLKKAVGWVVNTAIPSVKNFFANLIPEDLKNAVKTVFEPIQKVMKELGIDTKDWLITLGSIALLFTPAAPFAGALLVFEGITLGIRALGWAASDCVEEIDVLGEGISDVTKQKMEPFLKQMRELEDTLVQIDWTNMVIDDSLVKDIESKVKTISKTIIDELDADRNEALKTLEPLKHALGEEAYNKLIQDNISYYDKLKKQVQDNEARIIEIYKKAAEEHRTLTAEEQAEVNRIQGEMREIGIKHLSETEVEAQIIMNRLKENATRISLEQASEIIKNAQTTRDEAIAAAEEQYAKILLEAQRMYEAGAINKEQYDAIIEAARVTKDEAIQAANEQYDQIYQTVQEKLGQTAKYIDFETGEIKSKWQVFCEDTKVWWNDTWEKITQKWGEWRENFSKGFEEFKRNFKQGWFNFWYGIGNFFIDVWNGIVGGVESAVNFVIRGLNKFISKYNAVASLIPEWLGSFTISPISTITLGRVPRLSVPTFAVGGFPRTGELFIARETGPELVGSIGRRTAVANNDQIVEAVSRGVYEALLAAISTARTSGANNGNKEIVLVINGREVARAVVEDLADISKKLGIKFA